MKRVIFLLPLVFVFSVYLPALAADASTPVAKQETLSPAPLPAATSDGDMKKNRMKHHEGRFSGVAPEKREMLRENCKAFKVETSSLRKELKVKRAELDAQLYAKAPDDAAIQVLVKEISDLRAKMFAASINLKRKFIAEGMLDVDAQFCYAGSKGHGKK